MKITHWIALISGSILSVLFAGAVIFAGAHFVDGLTNDTPLQVDKEFVLDFFGLLSAILIILSVLLAWFKPRLGGLLIIFFAIIQISTFYESEIFWLQISIIPVGLILLIIPGKSRAGLKK